MKTLRNWFLTAGIALSAAFANAQCNGVGLIDSLNATFGICQPATNTYTITGSFTFQNPPTTGTLYVNVNIPGNGTNQTITINPPFIAGQVYNFTFNNIPADNAIGTVGAQFSANVICGLSLLFQSPVGCQCSADAGTFSQNVIGSTNSSVPYQYHLCFNDTLFIQANGDYSPPDDYTVGWNPPPAPIYNPGIWLFEYSCPPTIGPPNDLLGDPCFVGVASVSNGNWVIPNWSGNQQTIYYVPSTMYSQTQASYAININGGPWCYDLGPVYEVTFLSEVIAVVAEDCFTGSALATITGGMPAFDGSNFSVVPGSLLPATASFGNTTCANGGTIQVTGLMDQDVYSFDVVDSKNCPVSVSGTFTGATASNFSYPQTAYCSNDIDPVATLSPSTVAGGVFTATPAGIVLNSANGTIDLSASTPGTYTVNYNNNAGICATQVNVTVTINDIPTVTMPNEFVCVGASATLSPVVLPAGTYDYLWTFPVGVTDPGNVSTMTSNVAGAYSVQVTDQITNCSSNVTNASIIVSPTPTVSVADETFCAGNNATLTAIPGQIGVTDYTWTVPAGVPPPGNVASFSTNVAGNYYVQIVWSGGCTSLIDSAVVSVDVGPTVSINDSAFCAGGNAILTATPNVPGTYSYTWTVPVGAIDPGNVNTINTNIAGAYDVQINDVTSGCLSPVVTGVVSIDPLPTTVVNNPSVCAGANVNVSAMPGAFGTYSFVWTVPAGVLPPGNVSNFSTTVAGSYDVQITDSATGCQSLLSSGNVTINPLPIVSVNNPSICQGVTTQISATPTVAGGYTYAWNVPVGAADPGNVSFFTTGIDGIYSVVITDVVTLCSSISTDGVLTVLPNPIVDAGPDLIGCDTDNFTLAGGGVGVGGTYVWTNGVIDGVSFTPMVGTQTYTVTGTTVDGCDGTDDVDITVDQTPVASFNYIQDGPCTPAEVTFTNTSISAGTNCIWTFDNGDIVNGCGPISHVFNEAGTFAVNLQVQSILAGCVASNYQANIITVEETPIAGFIFSPDELTTLYNEVTFGNISAGATNYVWDFGDNSAGSTGVDPVHIYTNEEPSSYLITLIASTVSGCADTARALIEIADELLIYVPNAFTPDNNEFNRIFQPVFTSGFEPQAFNLFIFNRWGELIFESKDADMGWDGTYGAAGGMCQNGVYTWKITYRTSGTNERNILTGHVNLMR